MYFYIYTIHICTYTEKGEISGKNNARQSYISAKHVL